MIESFEYAMAARPWLAAAVWLAAFAVFVISVHLMVAADRRRLSRLEYRLHALELDLAKLTRIATQGGPRP